MKLISCYISAFGKFKEESFSFDPNLNCFLEDNGYGKSTLAAFLKAMLYGMEGYKTNAKKFPDRMHYYPAGASKKSTAYGGSLIFEKNGNEYRIERFFDEKSEIKDTLTVYKNGSPSDELGQPLVSLFSESTPNHLREPYLLTAAALKPEQLLTSIVRLTTLSVHLKRM